MSPDEQAVRSVIQEWTEASGRGDYAALEVLMHPEVVFLSAGNPPMGRDGFRETFSNIVRTMRLESTAYIRDLEVSGNLASACCWVEVRLLGVSGDVHAERAGYTLSSYKRNADGQWQLWRDANLMAH